jgi:glycosyltransferase involved in cell wall biosynthesis
MDPNKKTLTIAIPAKHHVDTKFVMSLMNATSHLNQFFNVLIDFLPGKSNIIHARSIMLSKWYQHSKSDSDMFLFIDSDHVFSVNDILKLCMEKDADVVCGIYCNAANKPNCYPMYPKKFDVDKRILYAGTGFMLIKKPICVKVAEKVEELDGVKYVNIDGDDVNVIPFFRTRIIKSEINELQTEDDWLGEDYSFCWLVRQVGGVIKGLSVEDMGHQVANIIYFRNHQFYKNEQLKKIEKRREALKIFQKKWSPLDANHRNIVYYCGNSRMKFGPNSNKMGGSEKAVVNLSRELAKIGHKVTVFGNVEEGEFDGVEYINYEKFNAYDNFDIIILWRGFSFGVLHEIESANRILLDFHDFSDLSGYPSGYFDKATNIMMKSKFHTTLFPELDKNKMVICKNGLEDKFRVNNLAKYSNEKREPLKFCYTSCYTRNLDRILLYIWPKIHSAFPEAELHLFYGMDLVKDATRQRLQKIIDDTPNVIDNGRIPIDDLIKVKFNSTYHLYITETMAEIDCLSVRESAVCGCVPIITNKTVFAERLGFHVEGDPKTKAYYDDAGDKIIELLKNKEKVRKMSKKFKKCNEMFWDDVAKTWNSYII